MTLTDKSWYSAMVEFLSHCLGPNYEISLYEIGEPSQIIAIENGHLSNRSIGYPLAGTPLQFVKQKVYEKHSWQLNYTETTPNGRAFRSSTLFLKDEENALIGLLCISFDDKRFRELSDRIISICHPPAYVQRNITTYSQVPDVENLAEQAKQTTLFNSVSTATDAAMLSVLNTSELSADRLTQEEKIEIIRVLEQNGTFSLKGAIAVVANRLSCSSASIYRYLSKIHNEQPPLSPPYT